MSNPERHAPPVLPAAPLLATAEAVNDLQALNPRVVYMLATEPLCVDEQRAAELLGVSLTMIQKLTREGRLPVTRLGKVRSKVYSVEALRRFVRENTRHETPDAPERE